MIDIKTGDFRELATMVPDESVDLILSDPVYQNIDDYASIAQIGARVLKPGGSCVLQVAHYYLPDALNAVAEHLDYVWQLVEEYAYGGARHWQRRIVVKYKPHIWFSKGVRQEGKWIFDKFDGSRRDKRYHDWGDSLAFSMWVIERLTSPGDLVLDPCLGGGTTALACLHNAGEYQGDEVTAFANGRRHFLRQVVGPIRIETPFDVQFQNVAVLFSRYLHSIRLPHPLAEG